MRDAGEVDCCHFHSRTCRGLSDSANLVQTGDSEYEEALYMAPIPGAYGLGFRGFGGVGCYRCGLLRLGRPLGVLVVALFSRDAQRSCIGGVWVPATVFTK